MSEFIYASNGEPLANERGEILLARAGEIVRCRDCRHFKKGEEEQPIDWCCYFHDEVTPLGFCAWGDKASTCRNESAVGFLCSSCSFGDFDSFKFEPRFCPNCGARVVSE